MFARIHLPGRASARWSNIIDVKLNMYDEVMISSMSAPSFKVTFSYNPVDKSSVKDPLRNFSHWWNDVKATYTNTELSRFYVAVHDGTSSQSLAEGRLIEYHENRENASVELVCDSYISRFFDSTIGFSGTMQRKNIRSYGTPESFMLLFIDCFNDIWARGLDRINIQIPTVIFFLIGQLLYNVVKSNWKGRNNNYIYKLSYTFSGTRYNLLKQLSQLLNVKIKYMHTSDSLVFCSFDSLDSNYTNISDSHSGGYIISEKWDSKEQLIEPHTLFINFERFNTNNSLLDDYIPHFTSAIINRLSRVLSFKSYEIWGYANKILYSGETLRLNNTNYYIKDISYEFKTLDSIKSFHATCIRFL